MKTFMTSSLARAGENNETTQVNKNQDCPRPRGKQRLWNLQATLMAAFSGYSPLQKRERTGASFLY